MFVYFGKNFTATATGSRVVEVHCEKCQSVFFYRLTRVGRGSGTAPYMLGQNAAQDRAHRQAQGRLAKRLEREHELVPCPHCRWVNESTIRAYRKTRHTWLSTGALIVAVVGGGISTLMLLIARENLFQGSDPGTWLFITTALIGGVLMAVQHVLRRRIDPNVRLHGGMPAVPPGTPPALVPDPVTGRLAPPGDAAEPPGDIEWATFRGDHLALPPLCCQCLGAATTTFKLPLMSGKPLPAPMCAGCLGQLRRTFWLHGLLAVAVTLGVTWVGVQIIPMQVDDLGRLFIAGFVWLFLSILAVLWVSSRLLPYRLRTVDASRAVHQIGFRNPAYTALIARDQAVRDGLA